ncbi:YifB family Mg chelatase-like AAA ATPase [Pseudoramibacter sp.]|jgi:magnesium chelatase family protein|uniref:YifB family Mg chelatase-like AAA ATPase n=1 Tax=Pseudoramibacter sp. TaxID=2034862 RepID=UPI0025D176E4|nr:YifB family Mg chelatase-like AAA ATPase [Pseudoramibacter sp.]MCH4072646.1 YifB family Mg chelatase-like AAA ATPase [Pseudoramibacter sp.]MCH4106417.1 YifB family Mg chelatase-like AAA ATPase [Pseudoramibacter sp.]
MLAKIFSCGLLGIEGIIVTVEVDLNYGLPGFIVVGLPDTGVKESRDRVFSAIKNNGYAYPDKKVTVNLAPADLKKEGSAYDLPIAIGLLVASNQLEGNFSDMLCFGELSLNGDLRPVRGVLPMVLAAKAKGFKKVILPQENKTEGAIVDGIDVLPARNLKQVIDYLKGKTEIEPYRIDSQQLLNQGQTAYRVDFSEIKGQDNAKRALEIAAAGGHNVLMSGPPGSGKSMLAKAFPSILPALTLNEALEITKIYSIAGLLKDNIMTHRPFRAPHHTLSNVSIIGGGTIPKPGEVSLAHLGVLFLDELPEFQKSALEVLRQPIEDHEVTISRVNATLTYPASFMLIASMNPCPCGYLGDPAHKCTCTINEIRRYNSRISGPLLDRIDIRVEVPAVDIKELENRTPGESSMTIRKRVNQARQIQNERFQNEKGIYFNAQLEPHLIDQYCVLDKEGQDFLEMVYAKLKLSGRGYHRILKLARTIADLDGADQIGLIHLSEATSYRSGQ